MIEAPIAAEAHDDDDASVEEDAATPSEGPHEAHEAEEAEAGFDHIEFVDSHAEDDDEPEVTTLGGSGSDETRMRAPRPAAEDEGEPVEVIGGDALDETPRRPPRAAPPLQDSGSDQAPAGDAGAGRQGGARQQGRGAHHLSVARRPLFGADAEHRAWRRHFAQNHQPAGPQPAQVDRRGARGARGHGRHPAHRRRVAHQAGSEARLRISAAHVGNGARDDAGLDRADARLRGRLAHQARDPRPLRQGSRRNRRRRRRRLSRGARVHAAPDAEPRPCGRALSRHAADLRQGRRRVAARRDVLQSGDAEVRRLHRHQPDGSAGRDRRQLGPLDPRAQYRGHGASHQSSRPPTKSPDSFGCAISRA